MAQLSSNPGNADKIADGSVAAEPGLDDVIVTELLRQRPSRPPDHAAENRALLALAQTMAEEPAGVLQKLVDKAIELTGAGSAGLSLLETDGDNKSVFRWRATAGAYFPLAQSTLPRDFSPCGAVLDRNAPQLMSDPSRFYSYVGDIRPPVGEVLLVPFHRGATPIGTVWVVAHGPGKHFDAEDARLVGSLAKFASAAVGAITHVEALDAAERSRRDLSSEVERQSRVYDTILSATDDFAYIFDRQGRFLFANRRLLEVWGRTLDQVIGRTCHDLGYPTWHADMHGREIRQVLETKRPIRGEVPFTGGSGISGVYDYIFTPVLGPDGEVEVIAGTTRDVTERKRAEEERERLLGTLEHERSRLAAVIEQAPAFICTLRGPQHVFELANAHYYEMVGRRDILGKPIREALPEVEGQGFTELLDQVYRSGETFVGNEMPALLRRQSDGSLERRFLNFVYQALREADGSISGIFVHGVDVTELVRSREALRESEARLSAILDNAHAMVYVVDADNRFRFINHRWETVFGLTNEATAGRSLYDVFPKHVADQFAENNRRVLESRRPWESEEIAPHADGEHTYLSVKVPLFERDGQPYAVCGISTDITDRKRAEEERERLFLAEHAARAEAERANRAKDRFLAVLSHELRTPLTPVAMVATAMEMDERLPYEFREDVAMIRRNVELETRLIDDLLDLSRVTSGKLRLNPQPTHLHRVIRHVLETVGPELHEKQLKVERELHAQRDLVSGDAARLQQTLWNLLKNAGKFTPIGGRITIRTSNDAGGLRIDVADTGKGIAADVLPRIFDPFEQGAADVTQRFGGMGLGLAIAKAVIDMHGGSITAASDGEGKGAVFTIHLPLLPAGSHVATAGGEPDAHCERRPVRLLLVEDHADSAKTLVRLLRLDGTEVQWAGSVGAAVELASAESFDVVLSDLGLPDGTGYDLMRQLRSGGAPIAGIAMSGYGMEDDIRQSREAGFAEHLIKPVNLPQLREAIRRVTQRAGG